MCVFAFRDRSFAAYPLPESCPFHNMVLSHVWNWCASSRSGWVPGGRTMSRNARVHQRSQSAWTVGDGSVENENDLPPLVLRARLEAQAAGVAVLASQNGGESSGSGVAGTSAEEPSVIVLDPETLVRRRPGAPLTLNSTRVEGRAKPTLKRALVHRARMGYQQLAYAAGIRWTRRPPCSKHGVRSWPPMI